MAFGRHFRTFSSWIPIRAASLPGPRTSSAPMSRDAKRIAVRFLRTMAGVATLLLGAGNPRRGRCCDLHEPRQRRRLDAPRAVSAERESGAGGGGRRASRLFQQDRTALGESAIPLGCDEERRLSMVDSTAALGDRTLRLHPAGSLPGVRPVLGNSRG